MGIFETIKTKISDLFENDDDYIDDDLDYDDKDDEDYLSEEE